MYYFPTYISSGGKEDAAADGHSYHIYTYMIVFKSHFIIVYEVNKVLRSIVDDMFVFG